MDMLSSFSNIESNLCISYRLDLTKIFNGYFPDLGQISEDLIQMNS